MSFLSLGITPRRFCSQVPRFGQGPFLKLVFLLASAGILLPSHGVSQQLRFEVGPLQCEACSWYKGNTHTHTLESDGDSLPEYVAEWYRDHGYDFLVLSDHNFLLDPATLSHVMNDGFLLIPGEEVTSSFEGRAVHVNGLNLHTYVAPRDGETLVQTIQANVDGVRDEMGIPHINHPNYGWSMGPDDLAQVSDYRLLEIFNGHPSVHNHGGGGFPGMEEIWDILLTRSMRVYGIAVDDAHHFQGEFSLDRITPGRGWVVVKASDLRAGPIVDALEEGSFYSSTGVELEEVIVDGARLEIRIRERGSFKRMMSANGPLTTHVPGTTESGGGYMGLAHAGLGQGGQASNHHPSNGLKSGMDKIPVTIQDFLEGNCETVGGAACAGSSTLAYCFSID